MAANTSTPPDYQGTPGHSTQSHPAHAHPPVSLEPAIEALLGQQAEISAKLAFLLPQKYSINIKSELDNLRHKLRVLRTFAENHQLLSHVPVLSEIEEARQLQYQIECIEAACLENGHNFLDQRVMSMLDFIHQADAPSGFGDWLRKNLVSCDPTIRAWNQNEDNIESRQTSPGHGRSLHRHFFKSLARGHPSSADSDNDPLLPPLKRSRVGPSRLESIGELRLPREATSCLHCRVMKGECDSDLTAYPAQTDAIRVVKTNLDFDDGFWWTEDLAALPYADPANTPYRAQPMTRPPPVLTALAMSKNIAGSSYNFWQFLKLSGLLSADRSIEATSFPYLFRAKLLLREVLFFDLQQPEPSIAPA
ncbi:zinc finger protein [Ophiostoma piceae UAMH 11346]|uniref:Zinc finger protein n=1 Tax=Ophiostoma piceae (strain UAMH 11346) TaxID=1262450 RepID=S3BYY3_OPHP1|nr:zinc finger protein [Ophiostoma piceae UAMH 11346]